MIIKFEYPMATEENMKAIQDAINAGMDAAELLDSFQEEVVWDCVVVLSGNRETPWAVLDHMEGNHQTVIEDWQYEIIYDFVAKRRTLHSNAIPENADKYAIGILDKVLLVFPCDGSIEDYGGLSWDYRLLDIDGNEVDGGGQIDDEKKTLKELIEELLEEYNLSADSNWKMYDFDYYNDK